MDQILFECTYTDSEEMIQESYCKVKKKGIVGLGIAYIILSVCILPLAIWYGQLNWGAFAIVLLVSGWCCLSLPAREARSIMKHIRRINHGTIPSARIVIDDKITHYYKMDTSVMLFENLRFVYFLKRSIVLVGEEGYMTFERTGFTKGSPEELEAYIREKYPHVRLFHKA